MKFVKIVLTVTVILFATVLVLSVVAPIAIQNSANGKLGSDDNALSNIRESLDGLNSDLEDSALGEWLNGLDN